MSKKDYIAVAHIISHLNSEADRWQMAGEFAALFKRDNPNFDRGRFMTACGVTE